MHSMIMIKTEVPLQDSGLIKMMRTRQTAGPNAAIFKCKYAFERDLSNMSLESAVD